jgi:hypothetical protein
MPVDTGGAGGWCGALGRNRATSGCALMQACKPFPRRQRWSPPADWDRQVVPRARRPHLEKRPILNATVACGVWPGPCCILGMTPQAAATLPAPPMTTAPSTALPAAGRAGTAPQSAAAFGTMLGRMDSGAAEPVLSSASANAPAQAAEGMPGVMLPGTPSSAGRKGFAGPAADAADAASGGAALGDARDRDAVAKDSAAHPRTPGRPGAPAPQAGGLPQATLSRRPKGAMPQPVDSEATSAAPPSPIPVQAETVPAPSSIPVNAAALPAATPPNIATGTPAAIVAAGGQSWGETPGSSQPVIADLPGTAAQASPGSVTLQAPPDAQAGASADPSSTAGASQSAVAEPSAAIMGPRTSVAFAMQAYGLQGAASPATSTKPGNTGPAADASAASSLGEPASGQAAAPLSGGPGSLPSNPETLGANGLALAASPVIITVASPVQSTQATRNDPVWQATQAASELGVIARAGDAPSPAGADIALPGPAGAALGVSNGTVPGGGNTATGQPPEVAAVLPGMPAAQRNASQVQPGHAARASPGHDSRDVPAGSPDQMPSAGAGAAWPEAVAVSPMFPEAANLGAEAARLAAAVGPALMGMTSPERPASAQTASTADGVDAAPAPPAMQQVAQVFAGPNLPQRMTLQLAPPELGAVQIGIERAPDGPAAVTLLVERADTLLLLMRDQPALHRALDAAGLAVEGRTLHFGLAQPGAANIATAPAPASAGGSGPASFGAGRDGTAPDGSQAGGSQSGGSQGGGQGRGGYQPPAESGSGRPSAHTPHRTSIDFTA